MMVTGMQQGFGPIVTCSKISCERFLTFMTLISLLDMKELSSAFMRLISLIGCPRYSMMVFGPMS